MNWFWKCIALVVFGPALAMFAVHALGAVLVIVLPYVLIVAVVVGAVAGLVAGLVIRRRLPPRNDRRVLPPPFLPLDTYRARRPRGRTSR